jgi:hypothetical protein
MFCQSLSSNLITDPAQKKTKKPQQDHSKEVRWYVYSYAVCVFGQRVHLLELFCICVVDMPKWLTIAPCYADFSWAGKTAATGAFLI